MYVTNREIRTNLWGSDVVIPKGTPCVHVRGNGTPGTDYAIRDIKFLMELTGNTHDPKHRYAWVPNDMVEEVK